MEVAWIGIVGVLAGLVIGGYLEGRRAVSAFRRERAWEINVDRRRRLEVVYEAVEEVAEAYVLWYGEAIFIANNQRPPDREAPRIKVPWAKLRMLVSLYLPDLKDHLAHLYGRGHELGSEIAKTVMESSTDPATNRDLIAGMEAAWQLFNAAADAFRDTVVKQSTALSQKALENADQSLLDT